MNALSPLVCLSQEVTKKKNKDNYRKIEEHQKEIEKSFGEPIVWSLMPDNKASKCGITCTELGGYEQEDFNPIIDKMIEIYQRFSSACKPFIDNYRYRKGDL